MERGDLVRIINLEDNAFVRERVDTDGYLWIAEEPHHSAMPGIWSFRSVATGRRLYVFEDRFERVEDAGDR
jgi:hypothetical protein